MQLPRTLDELRAVINECIQDTAAQVGSRAYSALVYLISLFSELALYAEQGRQTSMCLSSSARRAFALPRTNNRS